MLTLIFMQTLDLNVKNRGRIKLNASLLSDKSGKVFLVMQLDLFKRGKNGTVVFELTEL